MNRHLIVFSLLATLPGCQSESPEAFFDPEENPRLAERVIENQAARGARADANLFAAHFDGDSLNALGRAKLDLMLTDNSEPFPVTVYVAAGADASARQNAVRSYLLAAGLTASQINAVDGPNPRTLHAAAPQIANLSKTETAPPAQSPAAEEQAPPASVADLLGGLK